MSDNTFWIQYEVDYDRPGPIRNIFWMIWFDPFLKRFTIRYNNGIHGFGTPITKTTQHIGLG